MNAVSLTGDDTIIINNYVFTGLADGNIVDLTFPNDIANVKTGKDGNSIYGFNASGKQAEAKIRTLRASMDDSFLNNLLSQQQGSFASTVLMIGQFIKKIGTGLGAITSDTYQLAGGIFTKIPEAKSNVEGDTEQSIAIYTIRWASAVRIISA